MKLYTSAVNGIVKFYDEMTKVGHNFRKQSASVISNIKECQQLIELMHALPHISKDWFTKNRAKHSK